MQSRILDMIEKYTLAEGRSLASSFVTECEFYGSVMLSGAL